MSNSAFPLEHDDPIRHIFSYIPILDLFFGARRVNRKFRDIVRNQMPAGYFERFEISDKIPESEYDHIDFVAPRHHSLGHRRAGAGACFWTLDHYLSFLQYGHPCLHLIQTFQINFKMEHFRTKSNQPVQVFRGPPDYFDDAWSVLRSMGNLKSFVAKCAPEPLLKKWGPHLTSSLSHFKFEAVNCSAEIPISINKCIGHMTSLSSLNLKGLCLDNINPILTSNSATLRHLSLPFCKYTLDPSQWSLSLLSVSLNGLMSHHLAKIDLSQVEEFTSKDCDPLPSLVQVTTLRKLDLQKSKITTQQVEQLIDQNPNLVSLSISNMDNVNNVPHGPSLFDASVLKISSSGKLTSLCLDDKRLSVSMQTLVTVISTNPHLEWVSAVVVDGPPIPETTPPPTLPKPLSFILHLESCSEKTVASFVRFLRGCAVDNFGLYDADLGPVFWRQFLEARPSMIQTLELQGVKIHMSGCEFVMKPAAGVHRLFINPHECSIRDLALLAFICVDANLCTFDSPTSGEPLPFVLPKEAMVTAMNEKLPPALVEALKKCWDEENWNQFIYFILSLPKETVAHFEGCAKFDGVEAMKGVWGELMPFDLCSEFSEDEDDEWW